MIRHSFALAGVVAIFCTMIIGCGDDTAPPKADQFVLISKPSFVKTWDVQLPIHPGDSIKGIYYLDGTVHVLTNQNFDHAVKGDSGELLYQNQIGTADATLSGGPTLVTDGIVFPTTHTLELFTREGNFRRSVNVIYNITNQAVGNKNFVYVGMDFKRGCLAQADMTQDILPVQWTFLTFGTVDGPVAISENVIYAASEDGSVRACLEDRTPFWPLLQDSTFSTGSKIVSGIAIDPGLTGGCYFGTIAGKLYCLDKNTGRLRWQYFAGVDLVDSPQLTDTAVYQYVDGTGLVSLDKTTKMTIDGEQSTVESPFHTPRWTLPGASRILAEDSQFVYVVLGKPNQVRGMAAVDKTTGEIAFATHRRDLISLTSDPKGEMFYGVNRRGLVVAMKPVVNPGSYGEIALAPQSPSNGSSNGSSDGLISHVR